MSRQEEAGRSRKLPWLDAVRKGIAVSMWQDGQENRGFRAGNIPVYGTYY